MSVVLEMGQISQGEAAYLYHVQHFITRHRLTVKQITCLLLGVPLQQIYFITRYD